MGEFEDLSLRPPVLNHSARCEQPRDGFAGIDDEPDSPPRYRSMDLGDFEATVYRSAARDESYRSDDDDDTKILVYRSISSGRHPQAHLVVRHPWDKVVTPSSDLDLCTPAPSRSMDWASLTQASVLLPREDAAEKFAFELPIDLLEAVLSLLSSSPGAPPSHVLAPTSMQKPHKTYTPTTIKLPLSSWLIAWSIALA